jgi:hypothetical protein
MELYDAMTEGKGLSKVLTKRLKDAGIGRKHTTRNGVNFYFYIVNSLVHYAKHESSGGFENIGSGGFKAVEIRGI